MANPTSSLSVMSTIVTSSMLPSTTPILILKVPDGSVDRKHCALLGPLSLIIQCIMGVIILCSLLIKRAHERPKRPWKIWFGDVSKQVLGQAYVHSSNVLISGLISLRSAQNSCTWYFLNIAVDTTLGVLILYLALRFISYVFIEKFHYQGLQSGQYGSPPQLSNWLKQFGIYILALSIMKILVIGLFGIFPAIFAVGEWLLSWLKDNDSQVIFVVLIFPIFMNVLQFIIIDSMIKGKTPFQLLADEEDQNSPERDNQLFDDSLDSEGEDDAAPMRSSLTSLKVAPSKPESPPFDLDKAAAPAVPTAPNAADQIPSPIYPPDRSTCPSPPSISPPINPSRHSSYGAVKLSFPNDPPRDTG